MAAMPAWAADGGTRPMPLVQRAYLGILAHDRGPASDRHESGLDINGEVQFAPPVWRAWQWIGTPSPHFGVTVNTAGETSAFYAGVTYDHDFTQHWFGALAVGAAVHNGPLHQEIEERCRRDSDCGFGSRALFRGALDIGWRFSGGTSASLYYEHFSHYGLLAEENEGVDSLGVRWGWAY